MSGLLRSARPCVVALLTLALLLGINGFLGAIHSVHHLPTLAERHSQHAATHGNGDRGAPARSSDEACPVAAAALHLAATAVAAPPVPAPLTAEAELEAPGPPDAARGTWREPGSGRAPPSPRSLPS